MGRHLECPYPWRMGAICRLKIISAPFLQAADRNDYLFPALNLIPFRMRIPGGQKKKQARNLSRPTFFRLLPSPLPQGWVIVLVNRVTFAVWANALPVNLAPVLKVMAVWAMMIPLNEAVVLRAA